MQIECAFVLLQVFEAVRLWVETDPGSSSSSSARGGDAAPPGDPAEAPPPAEPPLPPPSPRERGGDACRVLLHTRLALLEPPYLENTVLAARFVRSCPKCQNTVAMALHTKNDNNALGA